MRRVMYRELRDGPIFLYLESEKLTRSDIESICREISKSPVCERLLLHIDIKMLSCGFCWYLTCHVRLYIWSPYIVLV